MAVPFTPTVVQRPVLFWRWCPPIMCSHYNISMVCVWVISGVCAFQHIGHYVSKHRMKRDVQYENEKSKKTNEFRDENHWRMEWSSPGPYFDGSFFVEDIMFHSVLCTHNVQYAERYVRQISLKNMPRLPINGGNSVHKWCAPAILDEGHCSDHQST